jgi:hypothetical protein
VGRKRFSGAAGRRPGAVARLAPAPGFGHEIATMSDDDPRSRKAADAVSGAGGRTAAPASGRSTSRVAPGGTAPDRFAREAEALRANLARRKAQQRARRAAGAPDAGAGGAGSGASDAPAGPDDDAGG